MAGPAARIAGRQHHPGWVERDRLRGPTVEGPATAREITMRQRLGSIAATAVLLAAAGVATAGSVSAARPDRFAMHVDDTFLSGTSEDCGFDILLRLEGTITFTDFYDRDGEVSRSLATYPGLFYTFINAA